MVTFDDDKAVILEQPPDKSVLSREGTMQFTDTNNHSIIQFLQRPQLLQAEMWKSALKRGETLFDSLGKNAMHVPNIMFSKMVNNKLDGFSSFRATAVFRIQVNAEPFQQGRLIMGAIPMPTLIRPRDEYISRHPSLLQAVNHVQIDINKQSEVVLKVPFVSPFTAFDLIHGQYPWARLVVMVYSELREIEQVDLEVLLWAHFEDIELGAPTSAVLQSPPGVRQQGGNVPQAQTSKQVNGARAEEQSTGSKIFHGVVDLASDFIPGGKVLGSIAKGIGSIFGWSKPNQAERGLVIVQRPTQYFGNVDGEDHSHVLAMDRLNVIDQYPGLGGTQLDECSLEYLTKIPQYVGNFTYGKYESDYGSVLWETYITPSYYIPGEQSIEATRKSSNGDTYSYPSGQAIKQPTILNYASSAFMYWTGSLVYTLRFMKTNFHSGRIEIAFHPLATSVSADRHDYVYRLIVDLRESSEVSFVVPYISPTPWKGVTPLDPTSVSLLDWNLIGPYATGKLTVRALTPLIVSNSVSSTCVECVVEVRAGDDFKLQGPCKSSFFPVTLAKVGENQVKQQSGNIFSLAGTQETRTSALESFRPPCITNNDADLQRDDTQKYCAGEIFGNFRSLTRRFGFTDVLKQPPGTISGIRPSYYLRSPEVSLQLCRTPDSAEPVVWPNTKGSLLLQLATNTTPLSYVSAMFAFYRGGLRVKVYSPENPTLIVGRLSTIQTWSDIESQHGNAAYRSFIPYMSPIGIEQPNQKQIAEFQVPFYAPTIVSCHWDYDQVSYFDQSQSLLEITTTPIEGVSTMLYVATAAADDLDFHSFIGVPFCIDVTTYNTYFDTGMNVAEEIYARNWAVSSTDPTYFLTPIPFQPVTGQSGTLIGDTRLTIADLTIGVPEFASCKPVPKPPVGGHGHHHGHHRPRPTALNLMTGRDVFG